MSQIPKATKQEIQEWDAVLLPGVDTTRVKRVFFEKFVDETTGVKDLPAKGTRNGGVLWRERVKTNWLKQDRKRRIKVSKICPSCHRVFVGRKNAVCCGLRCQWRLRKQRQRRPAIVTHI